MLSIRGKESDVLTLYCYHSRRLSTPNLNLMSLQRTLKLPFNWENTINQFKCQRMNFVFLIHSIVFKESPGTAPTLLTAQALTSASSEQSFQKHHWNMTGCWVSCDCEASAPTPTKRPGCSFHCQETPCLWTNTCTCGSYGHLRTAKYGWKKLSQNVTLQGNHFLFTAPKVDNKNTKKKLKNKMASMHISASNCSF